MCVCVFQGHMKTHSAGTTNELNASVVPQSSEGNYKDTVEAGPNVSSDNLQADPVNAMKKTSEKLSLTDDSPAGSADGGQEPDDRA